MPGRSARRGSSPHTSLSLPSVALSHRREGSNHRVVICKADLQTGFRIDSVASLGRPGGRVLHDLQAANEQMAEPVGRGALLQVEALLELVEDTARFWPDVEVAAEDQWR